MAESDTTNISDLPVQQPPVTQNNDEVIQNMNLTTQQRQLDDESRQREKKKEDDEPIKKKVSFEEPVEKKNTFVLMLEHKIIILATFFFFVFMDVKFKKYVLNVLVQIFGSFLKSEHGNMTKLGMFVYSLCYGSLLWSIIACVDIASFNLSF